MEEQKNKQEEKFQEEFQEKNQEKAQEESFRQPLKQQKEQPQGMTSRSYLLQMLAGGYLVYTGYRLCKNVLDGVEGASWGFFAAGAVFIIIGCIMLFVGVRGTLRKDKERNDTENPGEEKDE